MDSKCGIGGTRRGATATASQKGECTNRREVPKFRVSLLTQSIGLREMDVICSEDACGVLLVMDVDQLRSCR